MYQDYINAYFAEAKEIIDKIDRKAVNHIIEILDATRKQNGRLFIIGVGGGAGHASHAVSDFRNFGALEAYTPTDNISELTTRVNDDGWHTVFANWLLGSKIGAKDTVMVFSVGGGNAEKNISPNIVEALKLAKSVGAKVIGVVGRDGGYTAQVADACVIVPMVNAQNATFHTEAFQAVVWHLIASHPKFQVKQGKWESVQSV